MPIFKPNIASLKEKGDAAGLIQALKIKDTRTRCEAIKALRELGSKSAVPALTEVLLEKVGGITEKVETAEALGKIGAAAAIESLTQAIAISRERERALIDTAISSPDRRYREGFYINRISADEYLLRSTIATALARIGGEHAVRMLFEALASEQGAMGSGIKSAIKVALSEALAKMDAQIAPLLCDHLKHNSPEVRHWAAHCLGKFGTAPAVDALIGAACNEHEDFSVREAAIASLGQIGDARAIPYLEDIQPSENRGLAQDAQQCVAAMRSRIRVAQKDSADE